MPLSTNRLLLQVLDIRLSLPNKVESIQFPIYELRHAAEPSVPSGSLVPLAVIAYDIAGERWRWRRRGCGAGDHVAPVSMPIYPADSFLADDEMRRRGRPARI